VDWTLPLTGMLVGLAVAAPLGPVNLLVIRYTLGHGAAAGLTAGFGAVVGDGLYAAIAAFGVSAVIDLLSAHAGVVELAGGVLLLAIGARTAVTEVGPFSLAGDAPARAPRGFSLFAATFALTVSNPATLVAFLALFGSLGDQVAAAGDSAVQAVSLVAAVMLGSLVWWSTLTGLVGRFRQRVSARVLTRLNRFAGAAIMLFGLVVLVRAVAAWAG
jgi:threonine/homoserine/homoserine lactone efflux protein